MGRSLATLGAALAMGCSGGDADAPARLRFPLDMVRVDAVCAGAPSSRVLGLAVEQPYAHHGVRRFRLKNVGSVPHEVRASFVTADAGRCDGPFLHAQKLALEDAKTCAPPEARTLAGDEAIELRIPAYRMPTEGPCTKVALSLHVDVDGHEQCVELGAWIASRGEDAD